MPIGKLAIRVVSFLIFLTFVTAAAHAQYRGSLRGTVVDAQGNAVSGTTVTLTNKDTGANLVSTSDDNGIYQFNALPIANYELTAKHGGFKTKTLDEVRIIPDQPNSLDLPLEVGGVEETVTVSGTTQALDTETANLSGTVTSDQIAHLPAFGRDVLKLAQLAPGSFADGSQASGNDNYNLPGTQTGGGQSGGADGIFKTENGAQIIANGQQSENNGISIDGISSTSAVWGGATVVTPSEDSVESVKILSNSYDAEDGRFSGAQIQITSKAGTNDIHGSLFLTTHQPNLNAYQKFNGDGLAVTRDDNKFEQFGGSVGGPIWKNKIFAFFNYETVREPTTSLQGNGWYETPAFAALAPSGSIAAQYLSFPGNAVVGTLNPSATCATAGLTEGVNCRTIAGQGLNVGSPITTGLGTQDQTWQSATNPGVGGGLSDVADIANYNTLNPTKFTAAQYNGRLDANVTGNDHINFSIYYVPQSKDNYNGNRGYDVFHHSQINEIASVIWNHTFSPTFLNEARVNAASWRWNEINSNPQSPVGFPEDNIGQTGSIMLNSYGPSVGSILDQWTYGFKDVATKIYGRHDIKFGLDFTRLQYLQNCPGCGVPNYTFFNLWDFLNDAPQKEQGNFNPITGAPTTIRQDDRESIWGVFAQDDFKLRQNLTINVGLRWSYFGPLYDKNNHMYQAIPGAGADFLTGLVVRRGNSWDAQKDNFGPQIGLAWSPGRFHNKLVVRGGYGLNYNGEQFAISTNIVNNPGLAVSPTFLIPDPSAPNPGIVYALSSGVRDLNGFPANPNAISTFGANGLPTTGAVNVQIFPKTLPTTRVHHYSTDLQYDLGHQLIASLGYQGSLSRDTFFHENPLAVPATLGYTFNPQIGGGDYWTNNGRGNYNALLAELKQQFAHHFSADAQFTWSKCMDTSSAPYSEQPYPFNTDLDYGRCDYNVGNAFKIFGVWQPVFFRNGNWAEKLADGWTLSGIFNVHTGFPWTPMVNVNGGNTYCTQCGYGSLYPTAYLGGAGGSTSNSAFETVAGSNFPNGGTTYFSPTQYPASLGTTLPPAPGVRRNSYTLPGYKSVDMTLAKGFGLPKARVLGENARIELRVDAYNLFNNLNLNPNQISNNIGNSNFGTITGGLGGRVITLGGRFSF
jgi:hypothetical protein